MRLLVLLSLAPFAFAAPCTPVNGDRIIAADVATQVPAFATVDAQLTIGLAPFPGTRRRFTGHELAGIAERNGLKLDGLVPDLCFERALTPLTAERIQTAMRASIGIPDVRVEVVDFIRQGFPSGDLDFPRSGLSPTPAARPDGPTFWRGTLRYSPQHTMTIWATVHLSIQRPVIIAAREIPRGATVSVDDLTPVVRDVFPFAPHLEAQTNAIGRVARKIIPAGLVLTESLLEIPPDVARGDTVHVVAVNGFSRITFDAVAQSSGRKGDRILLLNPESHKGFQAVVDGQASAHTGTGG